MWCFRSLIIVGIGLLAVVQCAWAHGPDQAQHRMASLGDLKLEAGGTVKNLRMSYVTHGRLNRNKSNAVLLLHGFGANHHLFDHLIGPGKAFDPNHYFVIVPDTLGNTQVGFEHSTSPTTSGLRMNFPEYNTRDMVNAEHKLVTQVLGINRVVAVAGISMGAMKSVQFAVSYPDFMDGIVPIVGSALWGSQGFHYQTHLQSIIENCQGWNSGNYDTISQTCGANGIQALIPYFYSREWWQQNIASPDAYGQWWKGWWDYYIGVQDARDLLYLSRAMTKGWIGDTPGFSGDATAALKSIKAKTMFLVSPHDQFFVPQLIETQSKAIRQTRVVSIDSKAGHLICCGADPEATWVINEAIKGFLGELMPLRTAGQ